MMLSATVLLATQEYTVKSFIVTGMMVSVEVVVSPRVIEWTDALRGNSIPSCRNHVILGGLLPVAAHSNVTRPNGTTVWLCGEVVILTSTIWSNRNFHVNNKYINNSLN